MINSSSFVVWARLSKTAVLYSHPVGRSCWIVGDRIAPDSHGEARLRLTNIKAIEAKRRTALLLRPVTLESKIMTEYPPRIDACSHPPATISAIEPDVSVDVARVGAPNIDTAKVTNCSNQH